MIDDARLRHDGTLEKLTIYLNPLTSTHFIALKRFPCVLTGDLCFCMNDMCVSLDALLLFA